MSSGSRVSDHEFHWADYLVFSISLATGLVIAIVLMFTGKGQQNNDQYLLGGRDMNLITVGASMLATILNAVFLLGGVAEVYYRLVFVHFESFIKSTTISFHKGGSLVYKEWGHIFGGKGCHPRVSSYHLVKGRVTKTLSPFIRRFIKAPVIIKYSTNFHYFTYFHVVVVGGYRWNTP